jgi:hypothetical protein
MPVNSSSKRMGGRRTTGDGRCLTAFYAWICAPRAHQGSGTEVGVTFDDQGFVTAALSLSHHFPPLVKAFNERSQMLARILTASSE